MFEEDALEGHVCWEEIKCQNLYVLRPGYI